MAEITIAGIMRAGAYSPNHIGNDAAIFNATADQLRKRGCTVNIYSEEQFNSGKVKERGRRKRGRGGRTRGRKEGWRGGMRRRER